MTVATITTHFLKKWRGRGVVGFTTLTCSSVCFAIEPVPPLKTTITQNYFTLYISIPLHFMELSSGEIQQTVRSMNHPKKNY
jgi:hypothetical protein